MRDVLPDIDRWLLQNKAIALATVIETWGSSPRAAGAKMALTPENEISGSVSGGCVEGAVYETGVEVLQTGQPQLLHFGVADETAWEVGLACGGSIDVFVKRLEAEFYQAVRAAVVAEKPFGVATIVRGPGDRVGREILIVEGGPTVGTLGAEGDTTIQPRVQLALAEGKSKRETIESVEVFIEISLPSPTLVVVGGAHVSIALTTLAKALGYRTIVVDPRKAFGTEARFPHVDQLIQEWPDEALQQIGLTRSTAVAMLTHDPKLDDPALKVALPSAAFYVGALGSQKTQAKRRERLLAEGMTAAQLARLHGPIGLDLGGRTPEEVALAIMAEIVAARNGRPGER
jgi:xanthine dehydrogenase accessory factor